MYLIFGTAWGMFFDYLSAIYSPTSNFKHPIIGRIFNVVFWPLTLGMFLHAFFKK